MTQEIFGLEVQTHPAIPDGTAALVFKGEVVGGIVNIGDTPPEDDAAAGAAAWDELQEYMGFIPTSDRPEWRNGAFVIDTEGKAAWAAGKILSAREDLSRIKLGSKEAIEARKKRLDKLEARFMAPLKAFTEDHKPHKAQQIKTYAGTLALTKQAEELVIEDPAATLAWAKESAPELTWSDMALPADPTRREQAIAALMVHAPHLLDPAEGLIGNAPARLLARIKEDGETIPGCVYLPERNSFTVRAPKKGGDDA